MHDVYEFSSLSDVDLGRVDSFNDSTFAIAYTPVTPTTQEIMNRVSLVSYMTGEFSDKPEGISLLSSFGYMHTLVNV